MTESSTSSQNSDVFRLDQFLKFKGVVQSGGEAKHLIQNGEVKVNDEVETRRGRKVHAGDVIEVFGRRHSVK